MCPREGSLIEIIISKRKSNVESQLVLEPSTIIPVYLNAETDGRSGVPIASTTNVLFKLRYTGEILRSQIHVGKNRGSECAHYSAARSVENQSHLIRCS